MCQRVFVIYNDWWICNRLGVDQVDWACEVPQRMGLLLSIGNCEERAVVLTPRNLFALPWLQADDLGAHGCFSTVFPTLSDAMCDVTRRDSEAWHSYLPSKATPFIFSHTSSITPPLPRYKLEGIQLPPEQLERFGQTTTMTSGFGIQCNQNIVLTINHTHQSHPTWSRHLWLSCRMVHEIGLEQKPGNVVK